MSANPEIVEEFLENHNITYIFLLLANLESERLSNLPYSVKKKFNKKLTTMALEHIAQNDIPDYVFDMDEMDEDIAGEEFDEEEE